MFKLSDIKAGYLLQVRNGNTGDIFNMTVAPVAAPPVRSGLLMALLGVDVCSNGDLGCVSEEHHWVMSHFNKDLVYEGKVRMEVVAIYGYAPVACLLDNSTENRELLWKREEEAPEKAPDYVEVRKMTQAEIRELLGYEVEIVEG